MLRCDLLCLHHSPRGCSPAARLPASPEPFSASLCRCRSRPGPMLCSSMPAPDGATLCHGFTSPCSTTAAQFQASPLLCGALLCHCASLQLNTTTVLLAALPVHMLTTLSHSDTEPDCTQVYCALPLLGASRLRFAHANHCFTELIHRGSAPRHHRAKPICSAPRRSAALLILGVSALILGLSRLHFAAAARCLALPVRFVSVLCPSRSLHLHRTSALLLTNA